MTTYRGYGDYEDWEDVSYRPRPRNANRATPRQTEYFNGLMLKFDFSSAQATLIIQKTLDSSSTKFGYLSQNEASTILTYLEDIDKTYPTYLGRKLILKHIGYDEAEKEEIQEEKPVNEVKVEVKEEENKKVEEKENDEDMNFKKMFGEDVGKDKSGMFKYSMLGLAIKNEQGSYACFNGEGMVDVMDMVFDVEDMIFKMPVQEVKVGDLIIAKGKPVYVKEIAKQNNTVKLEIFNPTNDNEETYVPQTNLFGFNFFIKVTSFFEMNKNQDGSNINPMMFAMMMMDDDKDKEEESKFSKMMMMSVLMQNTGGNQQNQMMNMMPLMFMKGKDGKEGNGIFEMMMMQQMMQGMTGGNNNGFNFNFPGFPNQNQTNLEKTEE